MPAIDAQVLHGILDVGVEEGAMSATVSIEIPREVVHAARMSADELRQELATYLFLRRKLSFGKAREVAGMTTWAFQQLLGARGIPVHYDVEDYEHDLVTLKELGRL
jgi:predicted HTH domain antitoxin